MSFSGLDTCQGPSGLLCRQGGVVGRVRKHNANLMSEQGQYKEVVCTLNTKLKEVKGKLEEAKRQKQKLQEEVTTLHEKVEIVGTDAVQKFKTLQLFIDSCADYYDTGFDDCLKQVVSAFPELDLSEITMDALEPTTPIRNVVTDDDDSSPKSQLPPKDDGIVVLAQPAANPPAPVSKPSVVTVDVDDPRSQKGDENLANTLAT